MGDRERENLLTAGPLHKGLQCLGLGEVEVELEI